MEATVCLAYYNEQKKWFGLRVLALIFSALVICTIICYFIAIKDIYGAPYRLLSEGAERANNNNRSGLNLDKEEMNKGKIIEPEGDNILNDEKQNLEKVLIVPDNGSIMTRLAKLNQMLSQVRGHLLPTTRFKERQFPLKQPLKILSTRLDSMYIFMQQEGVTTLILPIINPQPQSTRVLKRIPAVCRTIPSNDPNTMLDSFYNWHADESLCLEKVRRRSRQSRTWWRMCGLPAEEMFKPQPFDKMFPSLRAWDALDPLAQDDQHSATYINILDNAFLTEEGMIISRNYSFLAHHQYQREAVENIELFGPNTPTYDEVFLMTLRFSKNFFHKNIEGVPRLGPYLEFLRKHPGVVIHVGLGSKFTNTWCKWFNISQNRFVQGRIRTRLLYIPEPSHYLTLGLQMVAYIYEKGVNKDFGWKRRDMVIMISRTGRIRVMAEHKQIKTYLEDLTKKYGLTFVEFRDDPPPSFEDSAQIFQRAVLVLGPHGAGMANVVFSRPGTYVVEVLCEPPKAALYMVPMSYNLGHHYYGISAIGTKCPKTINAPVKHTQEILTFLMPHAVKLKDADYECKI